jgi:hypothetical protein
MPWENWGDVEGREERDERRFLPNNMSYLHDHVE